MRVAGIRTPKDINELADIMPAVYKQFHETAELLEKHYKDMQDIEFTIEKSKLFMLQTRTGKRTPRAAICAAVEMVEEGLITKEEAILRLDPIALDQLLHPTFEVLLKAAELLATGLNGFTGSSLLVKFILRLKQFAASRQWRRNSTGQKRNIPRRYRRDVYANGDFNRPRRDDLSCGGCCPGDGKMLCSRMRIH